MRVVVVTPTCNESGSIATPIAPVFGGNPDARMLDTDDNSPDGHGRDRRAAARPLRRLRALCRIGAEGRITRV